MNAESKIVYTREIDLSQLASRSSNYAINILLDIDLRGTGIGFQYVFH